MPIPMPDPHPTVGSMKKWANQVRTSIAALRDRQVFVQMTPSTPASEGVCFFANIVETGDAVNDKALTGGLVRIGTKSFHVENYEFPTNADGSQDGVWLVEISIGGISFNTDDDEEFFLPGIKDVTGNPTWNKKNASSGSVDYTDDNPPANPTDTGTVVLAVGVLTVDGQNATINRTGCGGFRVGQCAGNFEVTRI